MLTRFRLLAAAIALAIGATAAHAQIYDGGDASGTDAAYISFINRAAESFSVSQSFDAVRFWGLLPAGSPSYSPSMFWEILQADGAGGLPGTSVTSGSATATMSNRVTGLTLFGLQYDRWQVDFSLPTQSLSAGTPLWLALFDQTGTDLYWQATTEAGLDGIHAEDTGPGLGWSSYDNTDLAFELRSTGTVTPEPTSMLLLGTGLVGVAGAARRRRGARS